MPCLKDFTEKIVGNGEKLAFRYFAGRIRSLAIGYVGGEFREMV